MLFGRVENENIFPNIFIKKKETLNIVNLKGVKRMRIRDYFWIIKVLVTCIIVQRNCVTLDRFDLL